MNDTGRKTMKQKKPFIATKIVSFGEKKIRLNSDVFTASIS
jgi:hypothetical protein